MSAPRCKLYSGLRVCTGPNRWGVIVAPLKLAHRFYSPLALESIGHTIAGRWECDYLLLQSGLVPEVVVPDPEQAIRMGLDLGSDRDGEALRSYVSDFVRMCTWLRRRRLLPETFVNVT